MAKNKKGNDKAEYPKLIKVEGKKVRVMNKIEEDNLTKSVKEEKKPPAGGWGSSQQ